MNSKINEYRLNEEYCDIDVRVKETVFKCHRLMLGAASGFFHTMLSADYMERTAREITVGETEVTTFEEILQFIYTGNVPLKNSNLSSLTRASDYFQISRLEEVCVQYIQYNVSQLSDKTIFELFEYSSSHNKTSLAEILRKHIRQHFHHFSATSEFLKIPIDHLVTILDPPSHSQYQIYQDDVLIGILRWIKYGVKYSLRERKNHFSELFQKFDCTKFSPEYVKYVTELYVHNLIPMTGDNNVLSCEFEHAEALDKYEPRKLLHSYVNIYSPDREDMVTRVFTLHHRFQENVWVPHNTNYSFDSMRSVVLNDHLYCLSYCRTSNLSDGRPHKSDSARSPLQTFCRSSSISLFPKHDLELPPLIFQNFDICGMGNSIFVYNKVLFQDTARNNNARISAFNEDELSRNVYLYNIEFDRWLPLPRPKEYVNACLTCDDQLVYLIGGRNSKKYAQAYDQRTGKWQAIARTLSLIHI